MYIIVFSLSRRVEFSFLTMLDIIKDMGEGGKLMPSTSVLPREVFERTLSRLVPATTQS